MTRAVLDSSRVGKLTTTMAASLGSGGFMYRMLGAGARLVFIDGSAGSYVSEDSGLTWTRYEDAFTSFGSVFPHYGAFNGTHYVTVYQGYAYRSTDGITWTQHALPENPASGWTYPMSDGTQFVIAAYGTDRAYTSPDGVTWTVRTLSATANWREAAWSGNLFIVCSSNSTVASTSPDGITWTARTLPATPAANGFARLHGGGNEFFLLTNSTTCYHSTDGISWTTRTLPGSIQTHMAVHTGSAWLVAPRTGTNLYSTVDGGANWTTRTLPHATDGANLYRAGGTTYAFVASNGPIYTTTDLSSWTQRTYTGEALAVIAVDLGSAIIVLADAGAGEAVILRSVNDGYTWAETGRLEYAGGSNGSAWWAYLVWDGLNTMVAVPNGWSSKVARSTDNGQTWSVDAAALTTGFTDYINGAVWTGTSFFIGMQVTEKTFRSTTGATWTQNTSIPFGGNRFVAGNGKVVVGDSITAVAASADDGVTWGADSPGQLLGFSGTAFIKKTGSSDFQESADGVTWVDTPGYDNSDIFRIEPAGTGMVARGQEFVVDEYVDFLYGSATQVEPSFARIQVDPGMANDNCLFALNGGPAAVASDGTLYFIDLLVSEWTNFKADDGGVEVDSIGYVPQPFWTGRSVIAGGDGYYVRLENGVWYREVIDGAIEAYPCGTFGAGKALLLAQTGDVVTAYLSSDHGKTWVEGGDVVTAGEYIESIAWDPVHAMFIAMPYGYGVAYTSPDGITWTQRTLPVANAAIVRMGVGGVAIAIPQYDFGDEYCTSSDGGITWTLRTLPIEINFGALAASDDVVILLPNDYIGYALRSTDNLTWTQHPAPENYWIHGAWNGRYFCVIGEDDSNDICAVSLDGASWSEGPFMTREANWYGFCTDGRRFYAFPYSDNIVGAMSGPTIGRQFWTGFIACEESGA